MVTPKAHFTLHRASRALTDAQEQRIAIDGNGLPFPVIVDAGRVYDASIWPFPELAGPGTPIEEVKFQ